MKFLGILTPEEAERDWGIPRNGDLVITIGLSSKSKKTPGGKNLPSRNGGETPESLAESAAASSAPQDPMLPAMNGLEDTMLKEAEKWNSTTPQPPDPPQPKESTNL